MGKDLHKRLEEAAEKYVASREDGVTVKVDKGSREETVLKLCLELCHSDYIAGAEHGYKEAIAQAREWLKEHSKTEHYSDGAPYCDTPFATQEDMLDTFDFDMNKLWEEKK